MPFHRFSCFAITSRAQSLIALLLFPLSGLADEPPARGPTPVGNDRFMNVVTQGSVANRFEIYNPRSEEQLRAIKEMGFHQVMLDWPNLHGPATAMGLDVVMAHWWSIQTKPEEVRKAIEVVKQVERSRLSAVSMMDEPERYAVDTPFEFYKGLYQELRGHLDQVLPEVKLEISHWGPLADWTPRHYEAFVPLYQSADRMRLMPYPDLDEGPLAEVYLQMMRSRYLMQMAGRELPQVVILQTWALEDKKLPTIPELRVMAYLALLGGAETISFYSFDPELWDNTPGFRSDFEGLIRELAEFAARYQGASVESILRSSGVFTATAQLEDGRSAEFTINTRRVIADGIEPLAVIESPGPELAVGECYRRIPCRPRRRLSRLRWR